MQQRLGNKRKQGINGNALRAWAMMFLAAGVIGRGLIQNGILGMVNANTAQLLEIMSASDQAMTLTTISLVLQIIETCAVPMFAYLLVEGMQHTKDFNAYLVRVLGLAVVTELPYNLAMSGRLLDLDSRNPVFSLVMCMMMLWLYGKCGEKKFLSGLLKLVITAAAVLWCQMLGIQFGAPMVVVTAVTWKFRSNSIYRNFASAAAAMVCTIFSPCFLAAPMGSMAVHFHDGEPSTIERKVKYLAYPVMLAAAGILGLIL